jgi:inhibitor of KinA sporulation pathway (predicted exonuclease)
MADRLDQIVVIDVEATCWRGPPPPDELQEIIEIGLCVLEVDSLARRARESILVRPRRSRVSPFCTQLTTLTQEQVDGGMPFSEACADLATRLGTRARTFASWGDFDRRLFEAQCAREEVKSPFGHTHLNVKNLFALARGLPQEVGMMDALRLAGLPHEGTHHRGHDDAWNIAGLLGQMMAAARAGR